MSDQKIPVSDFIEKYNSYKTETEKTKYIKKSIIKDIYMPYEAKMKICDEFIRETLDNGYVNSARLNIWYTISMFTIYTNLEITDSFYDEMQSVGLLDEVFKYISDSEKKEFVAIQSYLISDYKEKNKYNQLLSVFRIALKDTVDEVSNKLQIGLMDFETKILESLTNYIKNLSDEEAKQLFSAIRENPNAIKISE